MTLGAAMAVIIGFGVLVLAGHRVGLVSAGSERDRGLVAPTTCPRVSSPGASFSGF